MDEFDPITTNPYYDGGVYYKVKLDPDEYGGGADFFQREGRRKKKDGDEDEEAGDDESDEGENPIPSTHPDIHDEVQLSKKGKEVLKVDEESPVHIASNQHPPKPPPHVSFKA